MRQRSLYAKHCLRKAEERQLQAEEEFLVETLKKIKQQRNSLMIERLHLESEQKKYKDLKTLCSGSAVPKSIIDMMSQRNTGHVDDTATRGDDVTCNVQELNLDPNIVGASSNASKPKKGKKKRNAKVGSSSEVSEPDNVIVDFKMLMDASANSD